ncbi:MAG TPA: sialidase family protein [Gammaproteobacteria bacterium]|nr:sialidase family protein [Gammaproteobacteria bacterium]
MPIVRVLSALSLFAAVTMTGCGREPATDAGGTRGAADAAGPRAGPGLGPLVPLAVGAAPGSAEPHLAANAGEVVLSWIEPDGDGHALKYSRLRGGAWDAPVVAARGEKWVVSPDDPPAVVPVRAGLWVAHWRVEAAEPYAYDIATAVSPDGGVTWSAPRLLNDDGTLTEHGFVSVFPWGEDAGAVWLDGRDLASENDNQDVGLERLASLATSLRVARLGADGALLEQSVVDERVCDCCTTGAAAGSAGLLLVYRDRSPEEIRDIAVTRRMADGWSDPIVLGPDGWEIEGCPVNGPAIDADGGAAAVAWFTAAGNRPLVRAAFSADGGATFGAAIDVDAAGAIGHVDIAMLRADAAAVAWWRRATNGAELGVREVSSAGELGPVRVLTTSTESRPNSVPQLVRSHDRLLLAWTEPGEPGRVSTGYVALGGER